MRRLCIASLAILAVACGSSHTASNGAKSAAASASLGSVAFVSAPTSPADPTLVEWDWRGHRLRTVTLSAPVDCCGPATLSPDGNRLLVFDDRGQGEIRDVAGTVLTRGSFSGAVWADDSGHLCVVRPHDPPNPVASGPADLVLIDMTGKERDVGEVGSFGPHAAPEILRCSVNDDQAVVAENELGMNARIYAVNLSSGQVTVPTWAQGGGAWLVAISGDGRHALELRVNAGAPRSQIVETSTNRVVARLAGQGEAVSWNGHVALVSTPSLQLEAVDWRTNKIVWSSRAQNPQCPCPEASYAMRPRTNTDDFAIAVSNQPAQPAGQAMLWRVVGGQSHLVAGAVRRGVV